MAREIAQTSGRRFLVNFNAEHQVIRRVDEDTGIDEFVANPPVRRLKFPLFVGKRWKDQYVGRSVTGNEYLYKNIYTVTAYDRLTVQAGMFEAFKIWRSHEVQGRGKKILHNETFYYAPETKSIILSKPSWRYGSELLDYKLLDTCGETRQAGPNH